MSYRSLYGRGKLPLKSKYICYIIMKYSKTVTLAIWMFKWISQTCFVVFNYISILRLLSCYEQKTCFQHINWWTFIIWDMFHFCFQTNTTMTDGNKIFCWFYLNSPFSIRKFIMTYFFFSMMNNSIHIKYGRCTLSLTNDDYKSWNYLPYT